MILTLEKCQPLQIGWQLTVVAKRGTVRTHGPLVIVYAKYRD